MINEALYITATCIVGIAVIVATVFTYIAFRNGGEEQKENKLL